MPKLYKRKNQRMRLTKFLTFALGPLMAPLALLGALLLGLAVHPEILLARVLNDTANRRCAVVQLDRAVRHLGRGTAIHVATLRRLARPLPANVARQDLHSAQAETHTHTHIFI